MWPVSAVSGESAASKPVRSRHSSNMGSDGTAPGHVQSRLAIDTDDDDGARGGGPGSPSWDRALHNHSPLAALMRREFPGGPAANRPRHLFDDL